MNPNPDSPGRLSTAIDLDDTRASIETTLAVAGYFRLRLSEAKSIVAEVEKATSNWQRDAAQLDLARHEIDRMAAAFASDQRSIACALTAPPT